MKNQIGEIKGTYFKLSRKNVSLPRLGGDKKN